jgi:stage III sporulation protein AA
MTSIATQSKNRSSFNSIPPYFPTKIRNSLEQISTLDKENITEIRLRVNKPIEILTNFAVSGNNNQNSPRPTYLTSTGSLTSFPNIAISVTANDLEQCFNAVCNYSVHSFSKEISQGYITLDGGNRVGIAGSMTAIDNQATLKYINAMNFRVAHEVIGCGEDLFNSIEDFPKSVLIIGKPMSGKTTILRDLSRIIGENYRVSLIDERHELAAVVKGVPQNNVGLKTDVFDGYPKHIGISTALRVMSPEVIITDEIGSEDDIKAIENSLNAGVKFIASAHATTQEELLARPFLSKILPAFDYIFSLS